MACGVILYSKGDLRKGEQADIIHIEGDTDHPPTAAPLPEGVGAARLRQGSDAPAASDDPQAGIRQFEPISWEDALDRIARLMKDDRDQNFVATNNDGVTVNRWITTGILAASATTNETAFETYKVVRSTGMLVFDNQARV